MVGRPRHTIRLSFVSLGAYRMPHELSGWAWTSRMQVPQHSAALWGYKSGMFLRALFPRFRICCTMVLVAVFSDRTK